ncbi:ATP-binding protein [Snodgrassella communis]|uniref:Iron-sulfur cluster carrier protein n=1 Tax=Snodgrassella communis TaxID=2946699 RepID=A0A836MQF1_9NEIS|nr:iron-sulfur cluster carrier protein ApbC [Snodgrassella communis]KDN14639.1 [4Fe-4S] cluster assembly/repair protein ApbC [Snodgrassella communis]PIT08158.1 ATP-binding protein [Snodgrassella communis]PIT26147.1 ATP-binding protein [Snodgrassella communis]PIT26646.1 ATP-binding protein [Snodgrassella communis]PIT35177.1 ATP-binding protein [Snodgrassella communis]
MNTQSITTLLNSIIIPASNRTLGNEKAVSNVTIDNDGIHLDLTFPYPVAHLIEELQQRIDQAITAEFGDTPLFVQVQLAIGKHKVQPGVQTIAGVKNIIAVASGKGGVGKSTTSANLAVALSRMGARVGVLDADIYGPSQPTMLGVAGQEPRQHAGQMIPVMAAGEIQVMSVGFLVDTDQAVIWRGPMVSQALQQLLFQSQWDDVDYLIIDLPPGTGDIQLTLAQKIPVTGAVIVTTPQDVALIDARKAVNMFQKVNIPIFGVLENMSVHICSQCGHTESIFGQDGGKELAATLGVPLLGQLPLTLTVREAMDNGTACILAQQQPEIANLYEQAAWKLVQALADQGKDYSQRFPKIVVE